jgi:hypothetical protein
MGPRDSIQGGVPTDYETGKPLTAHQLARIAKLKMTVEVFRDAMHEADGSSSGDGWDFSGGRMDQAAGLIELALLLIYRAALENP